MRPLRIGVVAPGIPASATGPTFSVKELVRGLCDAGHRATVLAANAPLSYGKPERIVEIDDRAEVELFRARTHFEWRYHYNPTLRRWLSDNVHHFDVVDIQGIWSFIAADAARACITAGVPYILTPHGQMTEWDWKKKYWRKRIFFDLALRKIWGSAAAIRFVSRGEMKRCRVSPEDRGTIIPYYINPNDTKFAFEAKKTIKALLQIPEISPVILFLGRVSLQKGVVELVLAFDHLWQKRPDAFLVIMGPQDATYAAAILRTISGLSSKCNIRVLEPIYDEHKYRIISAATLFVTLSKSEGLPIAVLESMACGVPVLVTKYANIPEISRYGAGKIASAEPKALAIAMNCLISDPMEIERMSEGSRRLIEERFSTTVVLPELLKLYERSAGLRSAAARNFSQ